MNFKRWLLKQARRDDPIGHLAMDLRQDLRDVRKPNEEPLPRPFTATGFVRYLNRRGACQGAIETAERARREWRQQRGPT
jgi:hypothetical protein